MFIYNPPSQTQNALQSQSTRPVFLARHPPHRPIPGAQRQTRVLENRACRHRSLIIALSAAQQAPPTAASSLPFTAGTPKTLRPAQLHQILATRLLSAKTPLKLLQRTRVVLHEPAYYMLGLRESSAYPDNDIQQPVSDYAPSLRGTGYEGVSIKDVLQMSSGIRFNEDYGDFFSDINRMGRAIAFNTSLDEFVGSLRRERTPGTFHHYISTDTQVLGMVLRGATNETLASYLQSRIWQRIGMESDAYWMIDCNGMELAFGGLNATLRDYARFGQLYLNGGEWSGKQIVPLAWIRASITPDAPHLQPGDNPASSSVLGYGYQWWIPPQPDGDYLAIGIYNQFIYVHPGHKLVIAKSSAYPSYNLDGDEKELETIAIFRAIATHLTKSRMGAG